MIFLLLLIGNSKIALDQYKAVTNARDSANAHNMAVNAMAGMNVNQGLIPRDVYQEFDNVTTEVFRSDDGDTFLNDLLPLSKSVSIGKLVNRFRQASDAGTAKTSMSGQTGVRMDQVEYSYDGSIVPIHQTGYYRNFREFEAMSSEGFDALVDDQREHVATLRRHLADDFLNGHRDENGQYIVVDGLSWQGMKNDSRVASINLGASGINFDFTATGNTGDQIKAAFIQVRDVIWITNNFAQDLTYYISREMASNFERKFSDQYDARLINQELASLMGVAAIKVSSKLVGNEIMAVPLSGGYVRPITGMGINTVAMPRATYKDNYEFDVWGAIGFEVKTDYNGKVCSLFAQDLG